MIVWESWTAGSRLRRANAAREAVAPEPTSRQIPIRRGDHHNAVRWRAEGRAQAPSPAPPANAPPAQTDTKTGGTAPKPAPSTTGPQGSISPSSAATAAHAAADLLTLIFARYLFPDAEENYQRRIKELQNKVQPEIETRIDEFLKRETPRIAELGGTSSDLFITVELALWTQGSDVPGVPAMPVNLKINEVTLGTKNVNKTEASHSAADAFRCVEIGHCKSYELYSFPVSAAIRQEAIRRLRGVSGSELKRFNQLADTLKASSSKLRLAGLLNIYKLAKDNGPLRGPAAQQAIPMLRDRESNIRAVAALALQALGATEAIPLLREALAQTSDRNAKNAIQKSLEKLEGVQKGAK